MLNRVTIMGRLVRDPEMKATKTGTSVCKLTVACDRDVKDKATGERGCDFIDAVAWKGCADFICRYFQKGQLIVLSGRLVQSDWVDKNGASRRKVEILVEDSYFAGDKLGKREDQTRSGFDDDEDVVVQNYEQDFSEDDKMPWD